MNIDKLLNKKSWKGKEVGRALILTLVDINRNKGQKLAMFSLSDLKKMVHGLENDHEKSVYNKYVDLNNAVIGQGMLVEGYVQQTYHGYYKLLIPLLEIFHALEDISLSYKYPVIMTEKQYNEAYAREEEEARGFTRSFKNIVIDILGYYTGVYGKVASIPKPIKDALEATKQEPVTNEFILSKINFEHGQGYYQLPDGRRSDQTPEKEWIKAFEEIYLAKHNISIDGRPATFEEATKEVGKHRILEDWNRIYNGKPAYKEETAQEYPEFVWHYYEDPPEGLTKWDIIAGEWSMLETYNCYWRHDKDYEGETEPECFNEFIKDYPKLFSAIKEYIAQHKGLEKIAQTKPAKYYEPSITGGELADAGLVAYKRLNTPNIHHLVDGMKGYKPTNNGIAVIKEGTYSQKHSRAIDKDGYFINPLQNPLLDRLLETMEGRDNIQRIRDNVFLDGLKAVLAYNALIDILADIYSVPELAELKKGVDTIASMIETHNNTIKSINAEITGSPAERELQRDTLSELFPLIDLDSHKPKQEHIDAVRDGIANNGIKGITEATSSSKNVQRYIMALMGAEQ